MMNSFLNRVAQHLVDRVERQPETPLHEHTVVFPNKRASLFFNQQLTDYLTPPFWAPHYTTIDEIYQAVSTLVVADKALLVFYLYKAYHEVTHTNESFDLFYSWGEVLLNDFDDIDNNMVDAAKLFINITDIEQLTSFDFIDKEQEEVIRKLFANFSTEAITELHKRYLYMWQAMPDIYHRFRTLLQEAGLAYSGMLKRMVVEQLKLGRSDEATHQYIVTHYHHLSIVGFNVLNATDRFLFLYLRNHCEVCFYWDYDEVYKDNPAFEAGQFISDDIKLFGNSLSDCHELYRGLQQPKDIHFIAAVTDSAQSQYVGEWLQQTLKDDQQLNKTAVVLCDEHLLMPTLYAIPPTYGDKSLPTILNITMGYPMQGTPVASFMMALLDLYFRGWMGTTEKSPEGKWRYIYAEKVLQHPYTLLMNKQGALTLLTQFRHKNTTYPRVSDFIGDFITDIFAAPPTDHLSVLRLIASILQSVAIRLSNEETSAGSSSAALYAESIFTAWTMLNNYCDLMEHHGLEFTSSDTLIRLLRQAINSRTIAFHGEPAVGVQVMGILETRNLDFDNVILLSVNEGTLPKNTPNTSFILHFLREANGMSTAKRQLGLYAYYFYRLLQRAQHITLVYNNSTDGLHRGEMSRFMMQLQYEKGNILSPETTITHEAIDAPLLTLHSSLPSPLGDLEEALDFTIDKTNPIVREALDTITSLSPTALNTYLGCQFRFYLQYVCGFRQEETVSEDVGDNVFGSIFHNAMERFYKDHIGQLLDSQFYHIYISKNEEKLSITKEGHRMIRRYVDKAFAREMFHVSEAQIEADLFTLELNGTQLLNHEVIARYMEKQIKNDYLLAPLTIIATEQTYWHDFQFSSAGTPRKIRIGGIIDREDRVTIDGQPQYRIVDYKTSTYPQTAKNIDELFLPAKNRASYIFQAFYYSEVRLAEAQKKGQTLPAIMPTLAYIKRSMNTEMPGIMLDKEPITDFQHQCHTMFNKKLQALLAEIFDPGIPFCQTAEKSACKFCPFSQLCNRS